jgi:hypothetical protein
MLASMPEANRIASPLPATTFVRCRPKVTESSSPRRHDAVGENLVEFGGDRSTGNSLLWRATAAGRARRPCRSSHREPSIPALTTTIKLSDTPSCFLIRVVGPPADDSHLMRVRGPVHQPPWTRSTAPWTYSIGFLVEK